MAFTSITTAEILEGEATKQQIYRKIRDNFLDNESRLIAFDRAMIASNQTQSGITNLSTSYVDIPGATVDITVIKNSVLLNCQSLDFNIYGFFELSSVVSNVDTFDVMVKLARQQLIGGVPSGASLDVAFFRFCEMSTGVLPAVQSNGFMIPTSTMKFISQPGAGTWRYSLQTKVNASANARLFISLLQIIAVEL